MTNDDTSMTIETGSDGNFYEMTFDISDAEVNIEENEVVGASSLRTSLNVDVDYYVKDGVNIATCIHSDGIEYFSPSFCISMNRNSKCRKTLRTMRIPLTMKSLRIVEIQTIPERIM